MSDTVTFLASFPAIQSAIKITGNGDGMRIQLDIPESEMGQAIALLGWRQQVLRVTIEAKGRDDGEIGTISRTKAKRRKPESNTGL